MAPPAQPGSSASPTMPVVGQGGAPGQPPMGGSGGMSMPTQNRGLQSSGLAIVQQAVRLLEKAIPFVGVESEIGKDVVSALTKLAKHIGAGSSPGVGNTALQKLMMEQKQEQPLMQLLQQQQGGQSGGGGPGAAGAGGGGAPPPPMPTGGG